MKAEKHVKQSDVTDGYTKTVLRALKYDVSVNLKTIKMEAKS